MYGISKSGKQRLLKHKRKEGRRARKEKKERKKRSKDQINIQESEIRAKNRTVFYSGKEGQFSKREREMVRKKVRLMCKNESYKPPPARF